MRFIELPGPADRELDIIRVRLVVLVLVLNISSRLPVILPQSDDPIVHIIVACVVHVHIFYCNAGISDAFIINFVIIRLDCFLPGVIICPTLQGIKGICWCKLGFLLLLLSELLFLYFFFLLKHIE